MEKEWINPDWWCSTVREKTQGARAHLYCVTGLSRRASSSLNVLTWWWVTRSPRFPASSSRPSPRTIGPNQSQAVQVEISLWWLWMQRNVCAVFLGSSTASNDTTDAGEWLRRRHTSLQLLVTGFSSFYFYTCWKQDVQHRMEEGCILGDVHSGDFVSVADWLPAVTRNFKFKNL